MIFCIEGFDAKARVQKARRALTILDSSLHDGFTGSQNSVRLGHGSGFGFGVEVVMQVCRLRA